MWTGGMTVADSIVISLVGLLVVFSALAVLAVAVIIISKIIDGRSRCCNCRSCLWRTGLK